MVSSLQPLVLYSVPIAMAFDMLKTLHHLPIGKDCLRALFRRCTHEQQACLVSPIGFLFSICSGVGFFLIPPFSWFIHVFPGVAFLRQVLWPVHLCLCPRRARLTWAARFWVPTCSCWFFFVRFLGICGESACVPHLSVGRPPQYWRRL